jgi:hypothetical protein
MILYNIKNMPNKCALQNCTKRLTFIEKNTCSCSKCNMYYCTLHRLAETHSCNYDFKKEFNKESFVKNNKCVAEKVIEI